MTDEKTSDNPISDAASPRRSFEDLPAPAQRALKEAEERRAKLDAAKKTAAKEIGGRGGEDPTRFGDWEVDGKAIDF
ncbi:MAG: DUF1674 domain-containing protein [Pseudomonadota bacterium]